MFYLNILCTAILLISLFLSAQRLPILYLLLSCVPLSILTYLSENFIWFKDITLNYFYSIPALVLAYLIPTAFNPVNRYISFLIRLRWSHKISFYHFIAWTVITLQIVGVIVFDKNFFGIDIFWGGFLDKRVSQEVAPFPLNIFYTNNSLVMFFLIGYSLFNLHMKKKSAMDMVYFLLFSLFLLSSYKKSIFIIYLFFTGSLIIHLAGARLSNLFTLKNVTFGLFILFLFVVMLEDYYTGKNIISEILIRIFLNNSADSDMFRDFFSITPGESPFDYIPSDGMKFFGYSGISVEKDFYYYLRPNHAERYGSFPVLNYTLSTILFGEFLGSLLCSFIYFINFSILRFLWDLYNASKSYFSYLLFLIFSISHLPFLFTGMFKTLSIIIIFPLSTHLLLVVFSLTIPCAYVFKNK